MEPTSGTGWVRLLVDDGVIAYREDVGAEAGTVRVTFRVPGWLTLAEIARRGAAEMAGKIDGLDALCTEEGELAGIARLSGEVGGRPLERWIGVVYADDHHARIDAAFADGPARDAHRELVRMLVKHYPLRLGRARRRRYRFDAPKGWLVRPREQVVHYYAPGFPRVRGLITVLPAEPTSAQTLTHGASQFLHEDLMVGFDVTRDLQRDKVFSEFGLAGELVRGEGHRKGETQLTTVIQALLEDDAFVYRCRLETIEAHARDHEAALLALVRSVRPLPRPEAYEIFEQARAFKWVVE